MSTGAIAGIAVGIAVLVIIIIIIVIFVLRRNNRGKDDSIDGKNNGFHKLHIVIWLYKHVKTFLKVI